jgi:uncharacterized protein (TIGR02246 family)
MPDPTADERAIRDAVAAWIRASERGDNATLASILADDMLFFTPGRPPFGKAEFLAPGDAPPPKMQGRAEVREVRVAGDWAWTRCDVDVVLLGPDGGPSARFAGPTLSVWQRQADGRWAIFRDANLVMPVGP